MSEQSVSRAELRRLKLLEVVAILVIIGLAASIFVPRLTEASGGPGDEAPPATETTPYGEG